MDNCLPVLFCRGSHYQVGCQIGTTFKERIQEYYSLFEDLHEKFIPFYKTDEGRRICEDYFNVAQTFFPQYVEEMRGISKGAQIPFDQVLLMHLRVELQTYLGKRQVPECSTIFVNNENTFALAHNEDTSALVRNRGYVISVRIEENKPRGKYNIQNEEFLAYCYPGVIPGNSANINNHGFIFTVNALYPQLLELKRTPRQFINRAVISASSLDQIRLILTDDGNGIASGCSTNVAWMTKTNDRRMWNFEIGPSRDEKKSVVSEIFVGLDPQSNKIGHYDHYNMYKHLKIAEIPDRTTSSIHRQKRADQIGEPKTITEMLTILGDTEDVKYPIYRTPRATDLGATVATVVFDLLNYKLTIYVDNPKTSEGPVLEIDVEKYSLPKMK